MSLKSTTYGLLASVVKSTGMTAQPKEAPKAIKSAHLASYGGITGVCHLEWEIAADQTMFSTKGAGKVVQVAWADRIAKAVGLEFENQPALMALISSNLDAEEQSGAVLVAFEDTTRDLWISAVLVDGKPALGLELHFETKAALCKHVGDTANTSAIARVLCSETLVDHLNLLKPVLKLREPQLDPRDFATFKRPNPLVSKPVQQGLAGVAVVSALVYGISLLGSTYLWPKDTISEVIEQYAYVEDFAQFRDGCEDAFASPWPTAPGWALEREGCASKRMADPEISGVLKEPATAYQVFSLKPKHNAILARRAAETIYEDYPHQARVDRGKLLVLKPFKVSLTRRADLDPAQPTGTGKATKSSRSLMHRVEDAFLGVEAGMESRSGSVAGKKSPQIEITTKASLSEVLRRIATLNDASLAKLHRQDGMIQLALSAPIIIFNSERLNEENQ
jgi:hypothetical protein